MKPRAGVLFSAATAFAAALFLSALSLAPAAEAAHGPDLVETPDLADAVARGELPPVTDRVPSEPSIVKLRGDRKAGKHTVS